MTPPSATAGGEYTKGVPIFLPLVFLLGGLLIIKPLSKYPLRLASLWRLKASNQMVLCILYVVMYMRHTSNLEHAIKFAGEHIGPPLSLDLRKVLWDVETNKFVTIRESLDNYLEGWKKWNLEFVEAFHLIEGSLFESDENRRVQLLDKALEVMLEGTYESMLHYAQNLKNPITMLHMLGVILPILGLVIFPLVGSFLGGLIKWYHLAVLYNLILPVLVFAYGYSMLIKRPTGYGESKVLSQQLEERSDPFLLCFFIALFFLFIGFLPIIMHALDPAFEIELPLIGPVLNYIYVTTIQGVESATYGPFGLGALILSFFIPLSIAYSFGLYYKL